MNITETDQYTQWGEHEGRAFTRTSPEWHKRHKEDDSNNVWRPEDYNVYYRCECGETRFHLFSRYAYSLMARCASCGAIDEVYSG